MEEDSLKRFLISASESPTSSKFWKEFKETHPNISDQYIDEAKKTFQNPENIDIQLGNFHHINFLINSLEKLAKIIFSQYWKVFINHTQIPFITCSRPVLVVSPEKQESFYGVPMIDRQHNFTLSSKIHIQAVGPNNSKKLINRKSLLKEEEVNRLNTIIKVIGQDEIMFSSNKIALKNTIL